MSLTRTEFNERDVILPVDAPTAYVCLIRAFRIAGTIQVEQPRLMTVFGKITGGLVRRADLTAHIDPIDSVSCRLMLKSVSQEEMSSPGAGALALNWLLNEIKLPMSKMAQVQPLKCMRCGELNPRIYRYCGACGTPLGAPRLPRKAGSLPDR